MFLDLLGDGSHRIIKRKVRVNIGRCLESQKLTDTKNSTEHSHIKTMECKSVSPIYKVDFTEEPYNAARKDRQLEFWSQRCLPSGGA